MVTRVTPDAGGPPLQGMVAAIGIANEARDETAYLVVDQHGRIPPMWVSERDVQRAEIRKRV